MSRLGFAFLLVTAVGACDPATLKHTPDAAKQIDGQSIDAPNHAPASVTLYDPNNPGTVVVGAPVVFFEADGSVAGMPLTDSTGVASADVHPGASATAVIAVPGSTTQLTTIAGIQPGDHIIMGEKVPFSSADGTFTVSWNAYTTVTPYAYEVVGPCGYYNASTALSYQMSIYSYCKQSLMDIVVIPVNSSFVPIAYLEKPNVTYTAGGSTSVNGTYLTPGVFNAMYTNVDAALTTLSFTRNTPASYGYGASVSGTPANGMLSLSGQLINAQTSSVTTNVTKGPARAIVLQNMAGNAASYTMDLGATLLPWFTAVTADIANNKITVTTDSTGTSTDKPDAFVLQFNYSRTVGTTSQSYHWEIFAPEPGDFTMPALPADLADLLPKTTDSVGLPTAIMIDSSNLTWDQVRLDALDTLNTGFETVDTSTRLREEVLQQRGG